MKRELTERLLRSLVRDLPEDGRTEVSDTKRAGLRFRMSHTGRTTWMYEKRVKNGPKRRHTLGTWPALGLSEARSIALEIEAEASRGIDRVAIAESQRKEQERLAETVVSVEQVLAAYWDLHLRSLKSGEERLRQLKAGLRTSLDEPIGDLSRKAMQAAIDAKLADGSPVAANRLKASMSAFSKWCWRRGYLESDVGASLMKVAKETPRERNPSIEEVRKIYKASYELGPVWGPLMRLIILTGQRTIEIRSLRWKQIDMTRCTITKPGTQAKNGKPHITHLSRPAIEEIKKLERSSEFLFSFNGKKHVSGLSKLKKRLDKHLGDDFEHWTIHDLRTAMASSLAAAGLPEGVVDRILNHAATGSAPSPVARVYQRDSLLPQRAQALERWGEIVTGEAATLVQLHG